MSKLWRLVVILAIFAWGLWLGGLVYEMVNVIPLWGGNMPDSVIEWNARESYKLIPTKFYAPVAIATIVMSFLAMLLNLGNRMRLMLLLVSTICGALTLGFTLVYFFPMNHVLFHGHFEGLSPVEITALGRRWQNANWIRVIVMVIGFLTAILSFGIAENRKTNVL